MKKRFQNLIMMLMLLSLGVSVAADESETKTVTFNCWPPHTKVYMMNDMADENYVGPANEPLSFKAPKFMEFRFRAAGYQSITMALSEKELNSGVYPLRGQKISLSAGWPLKGAFTLVFLGIVAAVARPIVRRLRVLEEKKEEQVAFFDELKSKAVVSKDTALGQRLGNYLLTGFLGKGGMAVVYRGVTGDDHKTGEHVAVKVLSATDDESTVERFKREVQICQKLFHPNIVALHDWGMNDELIYLALELVDGGTLEDRITEGGLPIPEGLRIFDEILAGMEFAHAQGVTHRDLKPDNIMMTKSGKVKISDFGLAKVRNIKTVTVTGAVMGTPAYMAPEQIQGEPPSASMDQYALGVVAFQIFTGRLPFECEDMMQTITKHLIEEPPSPRVYNAALSDELCELILTMLEKEPAKRYADLTDVRLALKTLPEQNF